MKKNNLPKGFWREFKNEIQEGIADYPFMAGNNYRRMRHYPMKHRRYWIIIKRMTFEQVLKIIRSNTVNWGETLNKIERR